MKIKYYIEEIYKNNPSLNFCVFNINGDIIYEYSKGYQDLKENKIVKKDTKYGIGSITKLFTTIAILQLIDKNQLKFNDSIHKFFEIEKLSHKFKKLNVKIKDLLTHSSGICSLCTSESRYNPEHFLYGKNIKKKYFEKYLMNFETNIIAKPGSKFKYLNEGFIILGLIIEKITKTKYEDYIKKNIFMKVNMNETSFSYDIHTLNNLATPYITYNKKEFIEGNFLNSELQQAGGMISNIGDLRKFLIYLMKNDQTKIVSSENFKKMLDPKIFVSYRSSHLKSYYGMGFFINKNFNGDNILFHNGGIMGGRANITILPKKGIGSIVLSNSDNLNAEEFSKKVLSGLIYKKKYKTKIEFSRILDVLPGKYFSYDKNTSTEIKKIDQNKLELIFEYYPINKKLTLFPKTYTKSNIYLDSYGKNEFFTEGIIKYNLNEKSFIYNQYVFFKNK